MTRTVCVFLCALGAVLPVAAFEMILDAGAAGLLDATPCLQRAVDAISAAGGGRLIVPAGNYVVGGLELKSDVELHIAEDAALLSVTNTDWFPKDAPKSTIWARGATNVAVTGRGTVNGRGKFFDRVVSRKPFRLRGGWRTMHWIGCRGVRVEGVTILGGTGWTCKLDYCDGVVYRGVKMRSHANYTNDGIDILSRNVLVEDCNIDAEDDAIVFKTEKEWQVVTNVIVRNSRLRSTSAVVKFGTETHGRFRDVKVYNCSIACDMPSSTIAPHNAPGEVRDVRNHAISGIEISSVDGASLEDVVISNIVMGAGINTPVFVRLARRNESRIEGGACLRNVLLSDIRMTEPSTSAIACSISGVPGLRPQNVTIRNSRFLFGGGGSAANAAEVYLDERDKAFPMPIALFKSPLPAYGFYVRHADGVRFENVQLVKMGADARPPVVADDSAVTILECNFEVNERK